LTKRETASFNRNSMALTVLLYKKVCASLSFLSFTFALQISILNGKGSLERNWVDATGSARFIARQYNYFVWPREPREKTEGACESIVEEEEGSRKSSRGLTMSCGGSPFVCQTIGGSIWLRWKQRAIIDHSFVRSSGKMRAPWSKPLWSNDRSKKPIGTDCFTIS